MKDEITFNTRRRIFLERMLFNPSLRVRGKAVLELSVMDEPKAIPSLRLAIDSETVEELRDDMYQVLEQLRVTLGWPPGYFDKTAGSLADDPIERNTQEDANER